MSPACQQAAEGVGAGVAASLRAVDCIANQVTTDTFGRLFAPGGSMVPILTLLLTLYVAFFAISLLLTVALVRGPFWTQPWLAAAVYGWQLKRNLMSITNVMHNVTAAVEQNDPTAMKVLRFYHLGLNQMHQLDGNSSDHSQLIREMDRHKERMEALGLDPQQTQLNPAWLEAVKQSAA